MGTRTQSTCKDTNFIPKNLVISTKRSAWRNLLFRQVGELEEGGAEGAHLCLTGLYRPTEESIMFTNKGQYNAPSREAIYYRIHKLAYGASWKYDYETFVSWDAKNR